jgi:hypothetical protein
MYGEYGEADKLPYLPVLFGKGRPFDADHIVARNRMLFKHVDKTILRDGTQTLLDDAYEKHLSVSDTFFRLRLPNIQVNYRYWPKRLNRSDSDASVGGKMALIEIRRKLEGHSLLRVFNKEDPDIPWNWSAIPANSNNEWSKLPPEGDKWDAEAVKSFFTVLLDREFHLYRQAYDFVVGGPVNE